MKIDERVSKRFEELITFGNRLIQNQTRLGGYSVNSEYQNNSWSQYDDETRYQNIPEVISINKGDATQWDTVGEFILGQ